jgi:DnaJ family protein A protein 2
MVVNTKLYDILRVPEDADSSTIKKAYRDLVRKHHPDKGGDEERFKEIDAAYKVLSDPELREIYDTTGSVEPNADLAGTDFDILSHIFSSFGMPSMGGFFGPDGDAFQRKTPDVLHEIRLTLDSMYKGVKKIIAVKRTVICQDCQGKGGSDPRDCRSCRGAGLVLVQQQNGMFIMQTRQPCSPCKGTGKVHDESKCCKTCNASGYAKVKTTVEIDIPQGVPDGYTMVKKQMADEKVGFETGDLHIRIREIPDNLYTRTGHDLHTTVAIDLPTALVGGVVQFKHIDGRDVSISLPKGIVTKFGDTITVAGKGMPIFPTDKKRTAAFGDLRVTFHIKMPSDEWSAKANESVVRKLFS